MHIIAPYAGHVVESRSETITMSICSLIEYGFLPVFSIERKVMLYSNVLWDMKSAPPSIGMDAVISLVFLIQSQKSG